MVSDDDPARGPDYVRECLDLVKLASTVSSAELREELLQIATVYERLAQRDLRPGERPSPHLPAREPSARQPTLPTHESPAQDEAPASPRDPP